MSTAGEAFAWLCLDYLPGLGPVRAFRLVSALGSPGAVLDASAAHSQQ